MVGLASGLGIRLGNILAFSRVRAHRAAVGMRLPTATSAGLTPAFFLREYLWGTGGRVRGSRADE